MMPDIVDPTPLNAYRQINGPSLWSVSSRQNRHYTWQRLRNENCLARFVVAELDGALSSRHQTYPSASPLLLATAKTSLREYCELCPVSADLSV